MMYQPAQLNKTSVIECVDLVNLVYKKHIFILARNNKWLTNICKEIDRLVIPDVNKIMTSFRGGRQAGPKWRPSPREKLTALACHPAQNVNKADELTNLWTNIVAFENVNKSSGKAMIASKIESNKWNITEWLWCFGVLKI